VIKVVYPQNTNPLSPTRMMHSVEQILTAADRVRCSVCQQPMEKKRFHYGGYSCYSCRAFFRRRVQMTSGNKLCSIGGACQIEEWKRKNCIPCRYTACLLAGMRPELVLTEDKKKLRFWKKMAKDELARETGNGVVEEPPKRRSTAKQRRLDAQEKAKQTYLSKYYRSLQEEDYPPEHSFPHFDFVKQTFPTSQGHAFYPSHQPTPLAFPQPFSYQPIQSQSPLPFQQDIFKQQFHQDSRFLSVRKPTSLYNQSLDSQDCIQVSGGTVVARPPVLVSPENLPQGAKIFVEPGLADTSFEQLLLNNNDGPAGLEVAQPMFTLAGLDVKGQDNFNNFMGGHMNNYIKHNEYTKQTKSSDYVVEDELFQLRRLNEAIKLKIQAENNDHMEDQHVEIEVKQNDIEIKPLIDFNTQDPLSSLDDCSTSPATGTSSPCPSTPLPLSPHLNTPTLGVHAGLKGEEPLDLTKYENNPFFLNLLQDYPKVCFTEQLGFNRLNDVAPLDQLGGQSLLNGQLGGQSLLNGQLGGQSLSNGQLGGQSPLNGQNPKISVIRFSGKQ